MLSNMRLVPPNFFDQRTAQPNNKELFLYHFHHAPHTLLRLSFHGHFRTATTTTARLVRIIVPSPPGGSTDVLAHALSQQIEETTKQTESVLEIMPSRFHFYMRLLCLALRFSK